MGREIYAFSLFCAFTILIIILYKVLCGYVNPKTRNFFVSMICLEIAIMVCEAGWIVFEGRNTEYTTPLIYICNILYYILLICLSIVWLYYSERSQKNKLCKNKLLFVTACLPLLLQIPLYISTPFTGIVFKVENYKLVYSEFFYYFPAILFIYLFVSSFKALILAFKKENLVSKNIYLSLSKFVITPFLGAVLQFRVVFIPGISLGIMICILLFFIDNVQELISIDPLTQVNNRTHLFRYLQSNMTKSDEHNFYIIMMDINDFKSINDTYGHIEGDHALVAVAKTLKNIAAKHNAFISRYGGDEFLIAVKLNVSDSIDVFCLELKSALEEDNTRRGRDFNISLSMGHAKYEPHIKNVASFIKLADMALYENKEEYRLSKKNQ